MWIQLPRPLFSLTKGLCFGALSHLALITSHEGSSLTTTLGYLLWQIWEGAWKKGWFEERGDEVGLSSPGFWLFFLTSAQVFHRAPVNPGATYPRPHMEIIFEWLFSWPQPWLILEVSKVFWKKERKEPSSGSSLAHVAENYSFYYYWGLCQLASPDRHVFFSLLGLFCNRLFLIKLTTGAALLKLKKQNFWNQ